MMDLMQISVMMREIEINTVKFQKGRIELQSTNRDNGNITHYSLVFYGTLKSLTDKFGEDKLINLTNLNDIINFNYNATNVCKFCCKCKYIRYCISFNFEQ